MSRQLHDRTLPSCNFFLFTMFFTRHANRSLASLSRTPPTPNRARPYRFGFLFEYRIFFTIIFTIARINASVSRATIDGYLHRNNTHTRRRIAPPPVRGDVLTRPPCTRVIITLSLPSRSRTLRHCRGDRPHARPKRIGRARLAPDVNERAQARVRPVLSPFQGVLSSNTISSRL